jgi:hypothetical protein
MAELTGDPRCNFCRHLSSSHRAEFAADASVPCAACPGGRCPPEGEAERRNAEYERYAYGTGIRL